MLSELLVAFATETNNSDWLLNLFLDTTDFELLLLG
jgi:hypothetical protein